MAKTDEGVRFAGHFQAVATGLSERCAKSDVSLAEAVPLLAQPEAAGTMDTIANALVGLVEAARCIMRFLFVPADFESQTDWELVEDKEFPAGELVLEPAEFVIGDETNVTGETMRSRALEMGATGGQRLAEFLLRNQHLIPKGLRPFYLVFPGTVRRRPGRGPCVPCLDWSGERWVLDRDRLERGRRRRGRVLRPRAARPAA